MARAIRTCACLSFVLLGSVAVVPAVALPASHSSDETEPPKAVSSAGTAVGMSNSLAQEGHSTGGSFYVEQDSVLAPFTDKDYTMGVAASFSGWRIRRWGPTRALFAWPLDKVERFLLFGLPTKVMRDVCEDDVRETAPFCRPAGPEVGYQSHSLQVGVTAFAPRKGDPATEPNCPHYGCVLHDTNVVFNDRPYASLLYATYRRDRARGSWAVHSDFTWGVLGLVLADVVQSGIHAVSDPLTIPGGWHHQISDGGEPTLKYSFGVKGLVLPVYWTKSKDRNHAGGGLGNSIDTRFVEVVLDADANAGFYTNVSAGGRARIGYVDSTFWGSDRQPIANTRKDRARGTFRSASGRERWIREAYVWAAGGYSLWGYNALLQGQFRPSDSRLHFDPSPSDPNALAPLNRLIWDWQVGATISTRWLGIAYQFNKYRNLFEGPYKRSHAYWSLYLIFN